LETGLAQTVRIRADPLRFKQILLNLLSNALKFTPDGGTIRLTSVLQNGALAVSVSDTGVGIASEDQAAVFEKFYQVGKTTKGVREGTGLGLPITRRLVELQGGSIWLESEPGKGTTFTFTVNMSPHAGTRAGGSGRVL
jgi:signal transduction histidine kinase